MVRNSWINLAFGTELTVCTWPNVPNALDKRMENAWFFLYEVITMRLSKRMENACGTFDHVDLVFMCAWLNTRQ